MALRTSSSRGLRLIGLIGLMGAMLVPASGAAALYGPPDEPTLEVEVLQPICDGDVPYLQYAVSVTGTTASTATITWINPSNPSQSFVQSDLPLSGAVPWPGAEVDSAGNAVDWPGWRLEGDEWVQGDEWDWVRPNVQVEIAVNPEATVTVAYPPSSPDCLTDPPGETPPLAEAPPAQPVAQVSGPSLPDTGASVGWLAAIGATLLALGGVALLLARKRVSRGQ